MSTKQNVTAIITDKRGRVLSIGKNSYTKSHTQMAIHGNAVGRPEKHFLHAEVAAIIRCRDLSKAYKIFISRILKDGEFGLAKPCPICERAIRLAGIKIVEHT